MSKTVDFNGKPFHFIGIGGIGMSALAYVLAKRQLPVSGSDLRSTHITQRLQAVGAHIFSSQEANNLEFFQKTEQRIYETITESIDTASRMSSSASASTCLELAQNLPQVICSTAINANNSEYRSAHERGYPIFHRSDVLAALIQDYQSIAVAGTHGKTTTSSLIGYLLLEAGLDPTVVVGGEVSAWNGNARLGEGKWLVAEADESDGSLAKLSPTIGVITNIELDHPDHYQNLDEVINTFDVFVKQCTILVGCIDCPTLATTFKPDISYSLTPETDADYSVREVQYHAWGTIAQVWERGQLLGTMKLKLLGQHNLANALAAVAVGRKLGLDFETIASALEGFEGAKRRFEHRGEAGGIVFVDDYAHHPSELRATLAAARLRVNEWQKHRQGRLVAIFQPHRYSRTLTFQDEFAKAFADADLVILTEIYSAGEANSGQINGQKLAAAIAEHHPEVFYQESLPQLINLLLQTLQPGDLALFLGAGNLNQVIPDLIQSYTAASTT